MPTTPPIRRNADHRNNGEDGFLLVAMILAVALILVFLAVAAPRVAKDLQHEKELETVHRGNQYVRAIRLYYRKFGHYPGSVDELVKSNNIRFLRRKYLDPMTGKDDWRIIHVGENKTTVTGFFGQPLAGLATSGLGSAQGMVSTTGGAAATTGGAAAGGSGSIGTATGTAGAAFGNTTFGSSDSNGNNSSTSTGAGAGGTGAGSGGTGSGSGASGSSPTSIDATTLGGGGGPIMGVSPQSPRSSIIEIRKQTTYDTWEFLYDPRIEALYKGSILGGGVGTTTGGNALGTSNNTSGTTGTGTQNGSGSIFGSGSGSTFGSGSGSTFGSSFGSGSGNGSGNGNNANGGAGNGGTGNGTTPNP